MFKQRNHSVKSINANKTMVVMMEDYNLGDKLLKQGKSYSVSVDDAETMRSIKVAH